MCVLAQAGQGRGRTVGRGRGGSGGHAGWLGVGDFHRVCWTAELSLMCGSVAGCFLQGLSKGSPGPSHFKSLLSAQVMALSLCVRRVSEAPRLLHT